MAKIRSIVKPSREGKNVTLSEARAAFREVGGDAKEGTYSPLRGPFVDDRLKKKIEQMNRERDRKLVKTSSRRSEIIAEMVGHTIAVHDGSKFVAVHISDQMVGHKLGEVALKQAKPKSAGRSKSARKAG